MLHTLTSKLSLILTTGLLLLCGTLKGQQEPMYSQYMFNMIHINPAYAGNRAVDNITALYRAQWVGITGAPRTGSITWDRRIEGSNEGIGLQVYNDQLGIEKTTGIQAFYSHRIPFDDAFLSLGVSGGLLNYRANLSETNPLDPTDPLLQNDVNGWLPTAGFGMLFATEKWYVGLSVPALLHTKIDAENQLNQKDFGANNHYFLTGGYLFTLSEVVKLKPSVLIKAVKGATVQYDFNLNGWFHDILGVGVSYRTGDAFVGMVEFQVLPQLRIGYSYDYTISDLKSYNKGTHEIMLRLELGGTSKEAQSPRYY
jgi:Bacteroidetes-specific putative membrane protein